METAADKQIGGATKARNYQLDFLKLVLAFLIFLSHTDIFVNENTRFFSPLWSGRVVVHFYFLISGLLMANSIMKQDALMGQAAAGRNAMSYVLNKFKGISWQYYGAMLVYIYIYIY